jgi:hypothetical protein
VHRRAAGSVQQLAALVLALVMGMVVPVLAKVPFSRAVLTNRQRGDELRSLITPLLV